MREITTTPKVNYKIVGKSLTYDCLKSSTSCFSQIFNLYESSFDINSTIILKDFTTKPSQIYIKKYFEILSDIFKINIEYLNEETIEIKNFKSLFYLKVFLTLYRLLFEPYSVYGEESFSKHILFFEELCNSDFKKLDKLQQLCTSYNNSKIFKGGHDLRIGAKNSVKIISIKELEEFIPEDYQTVNKFFTNINIEL